MNEKLTRLQELLDRKLTLTSKMDSFQISAEIAEAILDLLKLIFKPYPIQTVTRGELAHTPDAVLAYEPLGKVKNRIFFEIKTGDFALYNVRMIRDMMLELRGAYPNRFHSLVLIAKSFDQKTVDRLINQQEYYPALITMISIDNLVNLFDRVTSNDKFAIALNREKFLSTLLKTNGLVNYQEVLERSKLPEKYSLELQSCFRSKDQIPLETDLRLNVLSRSGEFQEKIDRQISAPDYAEKLVLRLIQEFTAKHTYAEFLYNKGELFYEFKGLLDEKLHDHKLDLLDFKPYWQLDNIATKQVQVLTDNMNKTRQLATELDSLRDQLKSLFSQIDDEISREDHHLGAIQNDYVRGNITEICYHEELDKINRNIAVLKGRIDKLKALE